MQELCSVALDHGCSRVEFTTDGDNEVSQRFYDKLNNRGCPARSSTASTCPDR
jgi:hypothetical protein